MPHNNQSEIKRLQGICSKQADDYKRLRAAAQKVYDGLNESIDAAPPTAKPVFHGIVDLHDELNRTK